jgi:hypothetical protein
VTDQTDKKTDHLWCAEDLAAYLRCDVTQVGNAVALGRIPFVDVAGVGRRFEPTLVRAWAVASVRRPPTVGSGGTRPQYSRPHASARTRDQP